MLKGMLKCTACQCGMSHTYSTRGAKRYRYYVCHNAQQRGWHSCPAPSIPAEQIEQFVVNEIRCIGTDPKLVAATVAQARRQAEATIKQLDGELRLVVKELKQRHRELRQLAVEQDANRMAEVHDSIGSLERRDTEIRQQLEALQEQVVDDTEVAAALAQFDPVWVSLSPREQERLLQLLIEHVDYDGAEGNIAITFRPTGLKALTQIVKEQAA